LSATDALGTTMTKQINRNKFSDKIELAAALASDVAIRLIDAIAKNGTASLAVSGGSTPKLFFTQLSTQDVAWDKVTVILVDERYVAPDDTRSNEKLVRENLLQGKAAAASLFGFWREGLDIDQAETALNQSFKNQISTLDVAILGMGLDGHTASFFPGGNHLELATDPSCSSSIIQMMAEGAGEPRLTLTLPILVRAEYLVLHIEGNDKQDVLNNALIIDPDKAPPIRTVIEELNSPIQLYWAP
jgi:6-phosphogluconolactonase